MTDPKPSESSSKVGIKHILQSVLAAAFGVQSAKNRERDFQQGSAGVFIAAAVLFTVLFIGGVLAVVQMVIATH